MRLSLLSLSLFYSLTLLVPLTSVEEITSFSHTSQRERERGRERLKWRPEREGEEWPVEMVSAALDGYTLSYAPYTASPAGVALSLPSLSLSLSGFAVESCAYNPTLSPFHTALIALVAKGGREREIESVLVAEREREREREGEGEGEGEREREREGEGGGIEYLETVRLAVHSLSPSARVGRIFVLDD
jgi:hypothetical protein